MKIVVVINGIAGVGKDTICDIVAKHFKVINISSITPIKQIAQVGGWNGEKNLKSRKLLSDLKLLFVDYNDLCNTYLLEQYEKFQQSDSEILFVHIREPNEISKFLSAINCDYFTLLVQANPKTCDNSLGNYSDDNVNHFSYDYVYINDKPLEMLENDFMRFWDQITKATGRP